MLNSQTQLLIKQMKLIKSAYMLVRAILACKIGLNKRQKKRNIFISHDHNDAANLITVKNYLADFGFECFLAVRDINPGDDFIKVIEENLQACDAFLYIGSKRANESSFCQQEIGMAKGLKKTIISAMTSDSPPKGFIQLKQSLPYKDIDGDFAKEILTLIWEKLKPQKEIKQKLDKLSIIGFSKNKQPNMIWLKPDNWNDDNYTTLFTIFIDEKRIGEVKIAYPGLELNTHTSDKLPIFFPFIDLPFFSRVRFDNYSNQLSQKQRDAILYLLNDVTLMDANDRASISSKKVYKDSLFRNDIWSDSYR